MGLEVLKWGVSGGFWGGGEAEGGYRGGAAGGVVDVLLGVVVTGAASADLLVVLGVHRGEVDGLWVKGGLFAEGLDWYGREGREYSRWRTGVVGCGLGKEKAVA